MCMCVHVYFCLESEHDSFLKMQDGKFNLKVVYVILQISQTSQEARLISLSIKHKYTSLAGFTHHFHLAFPKEPVPYLPQST